MKKLLPILSMISFTGLLIALSLENESLELIFALGGLAFVLITDYFNSNDELSKKDMCKQSNDSCTHQCSQCLWYEKEEK